jgi:hypothetical protein
MCVGSRPVSRGWLAFKPRIVSGSGIASVLVILEGFHGLLSVSKWLFHHRFLYLERLPALVGSPLDDGFTETKLLQSGEVNYPAE